MNSKIFLILILAICITHALAKKSDMIVDEKNQEKFGVPIGTILKQDTRTRLYKPPPLSANFTTDDRMQIMWINKNTRNKYCKTEPGKLEKMKITYNYYWHEYCRNNDGEDICCDDKKCTCSVTYLHSVGCDCLSEGEILDD